MLFAGTVWLLAAVLAWPAAQPTATAVLLAAQAAGYLLLAVWSPAEGPPTGTVRRRGAR